MNNGPFRVGVGGPVGSGKTATDAIVWLLARGTDPGAICWVRPRDPWMLDRARVQPDPAVFLGLAADLMQSVAASTSPSANARPLATAASSRAVASAPGLGSYEGSARPRTS